jgi:hypothetical protein
MKFKVNGDSGALGSKEVKLVAKLVGNLSGRFLSEMHLELSKSMSVHAWGRDFDRSCPVEVVVAKVVGELGQDVFGQW